MSTYTIEERGQAGMDLVDAEYGPGWDDRIDLARLNMASGCHCIGGQLEGHYSKFAIRLNLGQKSPGSRIEVAAFNPDSGVKGENEALTAEYRRLIAGRRFDRGALKPALLAV